MTNFKNKVNKETVIAAIIGAILMAIFNYRKEIKTKVVSCFK